MKDLQIYLILVSNTLVVFLVDFCDIPPVFRYATFLRAVYSTCSVTESDKFPPTPNKVFIKLALVKNVKASRAQADWFTHHTLRGDIDQILKVKEPIEMDDILKADDKIRLVVVEGAPGIGKSTLAWELCRQWSTLESLKRFSLVVLLRLREEGVQSATDISDLFPCGDDPGLSSLVAQKVKADNGNGVLFVFDGFDEFPSELHEKSLVMDIIRGSTFLPRATVLVTNRSSASAQLQVLLRRGIDKHIEVMGFSEKEIFEFACSVLGDINHFNTYLTANPVLKEMMSNPLNCAIVVGVYRDTYESGKPVPHTQTQLYTELTLCLLSRYLSATGDPLARKLPDRLEDLPHDSYLYQQLVKVGKFAFEEKLRKLVIFKELPEGCSDLGLLVKHTALYTRKEETNYNFFHLTLQEYMSAFYISQLPADEQRTLFSKHSASKDVHVVWRFVAGLTKMQNIGWDAVKRMKTVKKDDIDVPTDVMTVDPFLIQCLYEAQDVKSCESVFGQQRLHHSGHDHSYALGYCISVCSNTWDVDMQGITWEGLEMLGHGMKSVAYGGGSIAELDLSCSKEIINEGEHLLQLPRQILQRITTLGLGDCDINQRGFENLAECIPYLYSLILLNIIKNPGGDGSLVSLFQALEKHGKLLELSMYCVTMGMDDIAAIADVVQPSSSLRNLAVGGGHLTAVVAKQLVRTVLSPSSLNMVSIVGFEYPLDDMQTISDSISTLAFDYRTELLSSVDLPPYILWSIVQEYTPTPRLTANPSGVKGGTKLSHILRENTSLKTLILDIPLDKDELDDIIDSLKDNHSLESLQLSMTFHFHYYSESEKQALDPPVKFERISCIIM